MYDIDEFHALLCTIWPTNFIIKSLEFGNLQPIYSITLVYISNVRIYFRFMFVVIMGFLSQMRIYWMWNRSKEITNFSLVSWSRNISMTTVYVSGKRKWKFNHCEFTRLSLFRVPLVEFSCIGFNGFPLLSSTIIPEKYTFACHFLLLLAEPHADSDWLTQWGNYELSKARNNVVFCVIVPRSLFSFLSLLYLVYSICKHSVVHNRGSLRYNFCWWCIYDGVFQWNNKLKNHKWMVNGINEQFYTVAK